MAITDRDIDQAFSDLKKTCGGVRNDYFGLLRVKGSSLLLALSRGHKRWVGYGKAAADILP